MSAFVLWIVGARQAEAGPRETFHASEAYTRLTAGGVVFREQWLPVPETRWTLVHAVATAESPGTLSGLLAVVRSDGRIAFTVDDLPGCPARTDIRAMTFRFRDGEEAVVRLTDAPDHDTPREDCIELYRAPRTSCTVSVPTRAEPKGLVGRPDWFPVGAHQISVVEDTVRVSGDPGASARLSEAYNTCADGAGTLGIDRLGESFAVGGGSGLFVVSPDLSSTCIECTEWAEAEADDTYAHRRTFDQLEDASQMGCGTSVFRERELEGLRAHQLQNRAALDAWSAGRRDEALAAWGALYGDHWRWRNAPSMYELGWAEALETIAAEAGSPVDLVRLPATIDAEAINNFGFALWKLHRFAEARRVLEEGRRVVSSSGIARPALDLNLGDLYRDLGDAPAAIAAYQRFLASNPAPAQRDHAKAELAKLGHPARP